MSPFLYGYGILIHGYYWQYAFVWPGAVLAVAALIPKCRKDWPKWFTIATLAVGACATASLATTHTLALSRPLAVRMLDAGYDAQTLGEDPPLYRREGPEGKALCREILEKGFAGPRQGLDGYGQGFLMACVAEALLEGDDLETDIPLVIDAMDRIGAAQDAHPGRGDYRPLVFELGSVLHERFGKEYGFGADTELGADEWRKFWKENRAVVLEKERQRRSARPN